MSKRNRIKRFPRLPDKRDELIKNLIIKLSKKYKSSEDKGVTTLADSIFADNEVFIASGVLPIDCVVSSGKGFPNGIIEIYGPEGTGKSAILEHTLAQAQKLGYFTSLFPMEFSVNIKRAVKVGLDPYKLVVHDAETIEDIYEQIKDYTREIRKQDKDTPIVIGWDTVAATPTKSELENKKELSASDMGKFAIQISKLFRRIVRFLRKNNVCLFCINQTRSNIGKMFGNKETTYGGMALKFYAWVRCRVNVSKTIKDKNDNSVGVMCEFFVKKNKCDTPHRKCLFPIYWGRGIDSTRAIWEYGIITEVFKQKGTSYRWHGKVVTKRKFPKLYEKYGKRIRRELKAASMKIGVE